MLSTTSCLLYLVPGRDVSCSINRALRSFACASSLQNIRRPAMVTRQIVYTTSPRATTHHARGYVLCRQKKWIKHLTQVLGAEITRMPLYEKTTSPCRFLIVFAMSLCQLQTKQPLASLHVTQQNLWCLPRFSFLRSSHIHRRVGACASQFDMRDAPPPSEMARTVLVKAAIQRVVDRAKSNNDSRVETRVWSYTAAMQRSTPRSSLTASRTRQRRHVFLQNEY